MVERNTERVLRGSAYIDPLDPIRLQLKFVIAGNTVRPYAYSDSQVALCGNIELSRLHIYNSLKFVVCHEFAK